MRVAPLVVVLVAGALAAALAGQAPPANISLSDYIAALDTTRRAVVDLDERKAEAADQLISALPPVYVVAASDRVYSEPSDWLLLKLRAWRQHPTAANKDQLLEAIDARRTVAVAAASPPPDVTGARTKLDSILSAREFSGVHGPTWLDRMRAKAAALLLRVLVATLGSSAVPTVTRILVYLLAAAAIVLVSVSLVRALGRSATTELSVVSPGVAPEARPWQTWQRDAHAAAADGRWREAVHFAYWCGIAFLEARGTWPTDVARTPREYVRQLPDAHASRAPLATFTRLLERVWYGTHPAAADDFARALTFLEQLGCPSR